MIAAVLSALLLSATPRPEASVTAGGGYDSNLNQGDASVATVGSGYAAVRAAGGASLDVGGATNVYAGLRLDGEKYPSYGSLDVGSVGAEVSLVQDLGERTAVVLTPSVARSWWGESARNSTTFAGQIMLRVKPVRDLALRGLYAYSSRSAKDSAFSSDRNRVGASVEWRVRPGTYLSVAGSIERGDEAFYRAQTGGGGGGGGMGAGEPGMGHPSDAFASGQEAYPAMATSTAIAPALELGLDQTWHLAASWETRFVRSSAANLTTNSLFLGIGARM